MPRVSVEVSVDTPPTARMRQVSSMFDAPVSKKLSRSWSGDVPIDGRPWQIGLIVGSSGSGKSTVARQMFGTETRHEWPRDRSVIDSFDESFSVNDISQALGAVGFNTIPAWLRPYDTLSNGEKFRCDLARTLIEPKPLVWIDEFTSVVDRQVAKIGSSACARYVRSVPERKFVAVGCHYDVIDWLQPDWTLEPATMTFTWRSVQRRPDLVGVVKRCSRSLWRQFAPYHYMTGELNGSARCWSLDIDGRPVAFLATLPMPVSSGAHKGEAIVRVSRVVVLPDWQGLGIVNRLVETVASAYTTLGKRFRNYPAHPAFIESHRRKPQTWRMITAAGGNLRNKNPEALGFGGSQCAVFEYVGPAMADARQAERLVAAG
jgi:hypothetical protein